MKRTNETSLVLTDNPVVKGDFDKIPKKDSNVVRVFISSTFTDMSVERNALMKSTFPELQNYFRMKGLDFEVVDMRWGVREEMVLDHMATQLCQDEIRQAQKISQGVSFIALLGDKYGSCPLPSTISFHHYHWFVRTLKEARINTELLVDWFILDENCRKSVDEKPSVYVLRPLSDKYKFINSWNDELRSQERNQWQSDQTNLRDLLQKAATLCREKELLTEEEKHSYFMAVTEREISHGILFDTEAASRALCFFRNFEHLKESDELANRYVDITEKGKVDPLSRLHLKNLIKQKIPEKLPPENIFRHTIPWHPKGVCPDEEISHKNYIENLCDQVKRAVIEVSERRITSNASVQKNDFDPNWYSDLLHHAEFCRKESELETQRKLIYQAIRALFNNEFKIPQQKCPKLSWKLRLKSKNSENNKIKDPPEKPDEGVDDEQEIKSDEEVHKKSDEEVDEEESKNEKMVLCHRPVVIYGPSGSGKTTLIASLTKSFVEIYNAWIDNCENDHRRRFENESTVKIVRFLGTSPLSCNVRDLLRSVIVQLWEAFGIDSNRHKSIFAGSFSNLCNYFEQLLWSLQNFKGQILICLDAVDQLTPEDNAYSMNWIPLTFPSNISVIVSMYEVSNLNEISNDPSAECLKNIRKVLPDASSHVQVHPLPMDTAKSMLKSFNIKNNHFLTPQQNNLLCAAVENCAQPLYLKLLTELTKDWKSFTDVSNVKFGKTCKELIDQLFAKLAAQHGRTLTFSLKYMSAARVGLTDMELEDLLSLDDEVLQDVYVYHLPAESSIIRLPPMLWRRIRQQLSEYLTDKEADGKTVVTWYHRQFWEAAKFHAANNVRVHTLMAEYFNGDWYGKVKPLKLFKGKRADYPDCTRNAPPMQNCFSENEPNLRKLNELPYHLILSYQIDQSADLLTDFDFLLCKLKWTGLQNLLKDFRLFLDTFAPGTFGTADLAYFKLANAYDDAYQLIENLAEQIIETKIVLEILINSADSLNQDWTSFGAQTYGRLNGIWLTFPRIRNLYEQAKQWAQTVNIPLIIPRYACLQEPGTFLRMTIRNAIYVPRRYRDYRSGFYFDGRYLYIREQSWNQLDSIQVYDLDNFGEQIQTIKIKCDIVSSHFFTNLKYLIVKTFSKMRKQRESDIVATLLNLHSKERVDLQIGRLVVDELVLSHSERILVAIYSKTCTFFDVSADGISCSRNAEMETKADFETASFSLDDMLLILINKAGYVFAYHVEMHKLQWTIPLALNVESSDLNFEKFQFHFLKDRRIVCRGIQRTDAHQLYILDPENGNILFRCEGDTYRLDIILIHKSERWIAVTTTEEEIIDNVKNKSIFICDIESGEVTRRRVKGDKGAIKSATFLGEHEQYLAFSRQYDPGILIMHIGTPESPSPTNRVLLKLNGHIKPAVSFIKDPMDNVLISVSDDNHLKVWDLQTIMTICQFYIDYPNIHFSHHSEKDDDNDVPKKSDGTVLFKANLSDRFDKTKMFCYACTITISPSQKYAASIASLYGRIAFFDLQTGDFIVVQGYSRQMKKVNCLIFVPNEFGFSACDEIVISSATESCVKIWDPSTGRCVKTIATDIFVFHIELVKDVLYVGGEPDEESSTLCSVVEKYNIVNGLQLAKFVCHGKVVFHKFVLVPEKNLICAWDICKVVIFEIENDENKLIEKRLTSYVPIEDGADNCMFITLTPDKGHLLCGVRHYVHIINLTTLSTDTNEVAVLDFGTSISCVEFTENSEYALIGCYQVIKIVRIADGTEVTQIKCHTDFIESLKLSLNQFLVTLSKDKNLHIHEFDATTLEYQKLATFTFHCPVKHLAVARDLSFLLVGPETAAPLAVLTFNDALKNQLKSSTSTFAGCLTLNDDNREEHRRSKITEIKVNDNSVEFYTKDMLSLSLNKNVYETCKSICNPFSSVSSVDDKTCCIT